ncbi:MAG: esterase [Microbacterium sp.]|uniref:alpha/beta hydrolase n=1 Tax=Microbacterium sp. TaxID=51671 RepID=UPI001AD3B378|nr:alpha/beta hydrolase-fold protein [Microbacterium sp.]MBN9153070.1 esterase [Microbacterium sp.]MBN9173690.1 esterase [Microbacterium sp.]
MDAILDLPIIAGPVPGIVYLLAIAFALYLLIRKPSVVWVVTAVLGIVVGAFVGLGVFVWGKVTGGLGDPLLIAVLWWGMATLGAIGLAVVNLWRSRWWRKVIAVVGIPIFAIAGTIGINAAYGLNDTVGDLVGIVAGHPIVKPTPHRSNSAPDRPIYETWKPPAGMPKQGKTGSQPIAGLVSGFQARDAGIYLPPAALVSNAPPLPLMIMMMGQPGSPDPTYVSGVADEFAAQHEGLAPIIIVADQLGSSDNDPACADSKAYGNAETYIKTDVVNWARKNLNIIDDPRYWIMAGYSNGGGCAVKYVAQEPNVFKNLIDISGEIYPGSEDPQSVTDTIYGGSAAAFDAAKPITIMQKAPRGAYDGVTAFFSAGQLDPQYQGEASQVSAAAKAVGMNVTYTVIPGVGHVGADVPDSLTAAFALFYPVLGLSPPQ